MADRPTQGDGSGPDRPVDPQGFERFACDVARAAGELIAERFRDRTSLRISSKGLHDFVTEVDHEAEAVIVGAIAGRFPGHSVMAEEGSPTVEAGGHRWIVDPLDGTTNFIHGVPVFAVSIALEDDLGLSAGAIFDPLRDEMFHAARGSGARLNGKEISCSEPQNMHQALLATGFPFRELSRLDGYMASFSSFVREAAGIRRAGSAAVDLAYTACGRYDGFWEVGLSAWDVAAGALLVREAGGVVTDIVGGDQFLIGDIVAAGRAIHPTMLEITRKAFG